MLSRIAAYPRRRRGEAFGSLNAWGSRVQQGLARQASPIKGWESCAGPWAHVLVCRAGGVCVTCACIHPRVPLCVRVLVAAFVLHRFVCVCVNPPVHASACVPHTSVCASTCVAVPLCVHTHTHPACLCLCLFTHPRVTVHAPGSV